MLPNNLNILTERKVSSSSIISTSLNGPINKPKNSIRINDACSNLTKKELLNGIPNVDTNLKNELNKLNQIYNNKKDELYDVTKEYQKLNENFSQKYHILEKNKAKYESLRQNNLNLKIMILNLMKVKNKIKDK
jgi:predicted nuclease with TOPRIM domain